MGILFLMQEKKMHQVVLAKKGRPIVDGDYFI